MDEQKEAHPAPPRREVRRLRVIWILFALVFTALAAGLGYWQLVRSREATALERRQTFRRVMAPAPRGVIYDREHRVLAGNRVRTSAVVNLGDLRADWDNEAARNGVELKQARFNVLQRHLDRITTLTGRPSGLLDQHALARHLAGDRLKPFVLIDTLTGMEVEALHAKLSATDPVRLQRTTERWYPHGRVAAHVLGRVRSEVIHTPVGRDFPIRNYVEAVGESGLEQHYDAQLRGQPGRAVVRVDAAGFSAGPAFDRIEAAPGGEVVTSLDLELQQAAGRAMAATPGTPRGAAVVIAVATGEVLALVSQPDFDLSAVSPVMSVQTKARVDAEGGWLNRATQGLYPPGSSFKIFTALAGLRAGTLSPDATVPCPGYLDWGGRRFPCHYAAGHGDVDLKSALAYSCNVYAYRTGLGAGAGALAAEARRFHFHEKTGVDLPFETDRMLVPDPAWKQKEEQAAWTGGDTLNLAIGQGFLRYTPLQAACAVASLARRETLTVPTLLADPDRRPSGERPAEPLGVSDEAYAGLIKGMEAVVEIGIGKNAQVPGVRIAGKTGTAQVERKEGMMNIAWFIAFAPVENPQIAIAVVLEGDQPGVEFAGAEHAAPVVREIVGTYFEQPGAEQRKK